MKLSDNVKEHIYSLNVRNILALDKLKRGVIIIESIEQRVLKLEQKVKELEDFIKESEKEKEINSYNNEAVVSNSYVNTQPQQPIPQPQPNPMFQPYRMKQPLQKMPIKEPSKKENKIKEALVGKYIIGALASLLVFIGAISLIGLVWNDLTPEVKLLLISSVGILLTGLGFWFIRTKKNPITSIILGTGSGLLFISILSANMSFHLIGNYTTIILACIWSTFFILSSRYTNVFFTTIIAYIGSYIALILGLSLLKGDAELLVMTLFTTVVSGVMIQNSFRNKKNFELIISIVLSLLSYMTISFRAFFDGFLFSNQLLDSYVAQTIVIVIICILLNVVYKLTDKKIVIPWYIGVGKLTTISVALYIYNLSSNYLFLEPLTCFIIFFIVNTIQLVLSNLLFKNTYKVLTPYYTIILIISAIFINMELTDAPTGIIIVGILLIIIDLIYKRNNYLLICLIVLIDSLFLVVNDSIQIIYSIYGVFQLLLIAYILYKNHRLKDYKHIDLVKIIGIITIIINSFAIPRNIIEYIISQNEFTEYNLTKTIGYSIAVISFATIMKLGYFKNWEDENFRIFDRNSEIKMNEYMKILLYSSSTILYIIGLNGISISDIWYEQLIFTISTIVIALIQTYNIIINKNNKKQLSEIWIGIKYLIFTWTVLNSYFDLEVNSVIYSISGLIIAVASISLGFKFRFKNLRLYGLILTILMVIKFIIVDLSEENSITRVIALIIGGLICFGISVIYNKLSNKIDS